MTSGQAPRLVLIHKKTKQRYPLRGEDFVIGRSTGDLIFDHDPKLSGRHCLIRYTPQGFAIYDLKTRTGVQINGIALPNGKACILKVGSEVHIGDQYFTVAEDKPKRRSKSRNTSGLSAPMMMGVCAVILGVAWYAGGGTTGSAKNLMSQVSPVNLKPEVIDAEYIEIVNRTDAFWYSLRQRELTEEQALRTIRQDLLPRFTSVHQQLQAYRPPEGDLDAKWDFKRRIAGAQVGQLTAMANFIETKDIKYNLQLDQFQRQMQILLSQDQDGARQPSSAESATEDPK